MPVASFKVAVLMAFDPFTRVPPGRKLTVPPAL